MFYTLYIVLFLEVPSRYNLKKKGRKRIDENTTISLLFIFLDLWSRSPFSPYLWRFVSQLQLLGMGLYGDVRHSTWALLIQALEVGNYDDRAMSSLSYSKSL